MAEIHVGRRRRQGVLLVYIVLRGPKNATPAAASDEAEDTETVAAR
jgi:hypothetical protein